MILEACVGNVSDAIKAQNNGAHQLELCDRLDLDGISPPLELIKKVLNNVTIPVKVIVNPIPFRYTYSKNDLYRIRDYINLIKVLPLDGIVFGALNENKLPDLDAISCIRNHYDGDITFHKAIDECIDIPQAISMLTEQDMISYILTSGGAPTADEGINQLIDMKTMLQEKESNIEIIAAGKISRTTLPELHAKLQIKFYHGKKIVEK